MKLVRMIMAAAFVSLSLMASAQTAASKQTQITDEDLKKYAITMDSVQGMQQTLNQIIAEQVQKNTVMKVQRYNELFKIEKDAAQLTAANATPEEIAFLKDIAALREYNIQRINAAYQSLAKDYVGAKAFNAIRKGLEADQALKARYENVSQGLQSKSSSTTPASGSKGR